MGLFAQILACKELFHRHIQRTCNDQRDQHAGQDIGAVIDERINIGIGLYTKTGDFGRLDHTINGYTTDKMHDESAETANDSARENAPCFTAEQSA